MGVRTGHSNGQNDKAARREESGSDGSLLGAEVREKPEKASNRLVVLAVIGEGWLRPGSYRDVEKATG